VEVRGEGVERINIGDAAGVVHVLAGNHPGLHGGQHGHEELGELHRVLQMMHGTRRVSKIEDAAT
jgi:hypothetical protein